jgi:hypothetical protein
MGLPGAEITLRIDSGRVGRTVVNPDGRWCFEKEFLPILKKGEHSVKVTHSDGIGANETAYASITITDTTKTEESRKTYCSNYDPAIKIFHIIDPELPEGKVCFSDEDFNIGADKSVNISGKYVNNDNLPRHWLKFRIVNTAAPYKSEAWEQEIVTAGKTYDDWAIPLFETESWNQFVYLIMSGLQSGETTSFCFEAWDLSTSAYDNFCFCVEKT